MPVAAGAEIFETLKPRGKPFPVFWIVLTVRAAKRATCAAMV
jgi:hypothetical protein